MASLTYRGMFVRSFVRLGPTEMKAVEKWKKKKAFYSPSEIKRVCFWPTTTTAEGRQRSLSVSLCRLKASSSSSLFSPQAIVWVLIAQGGFEEAKSSCWLAAWSSSWFSISPKHLKPLSVCRRLSRFSRGGAVLMTTQRETTGRELRALLEWNSGINLAT